MVERGPGAGAGERASRVRGARRGEHVHRGLGHLHGDGARHHAAHVRRRARPRPRLLHLQPPLQPHGAQSVAPDGRHGGHRGRLLHRQRHVRHRLRVPPGLRRRRARGGLAAALRRHPRAAVALPSSGLRDTDDLRGCRGPGGGGGSHQGGGDEGAVHGVGCEPDAGGGGRPRAVRGGAREGGDGSGGQHVRAHGDVAGQDGRRRRRPQRLQVHQRRGRHHRRGDMRPGEPGELNDGPAQRGADAAGADHERQGGLRDLGAAAPPGTAHEGALPPRHGLRRAHAQAGPPGGVPGPPRPPPPRALQVPGQPRLRLRRHAVPGHGHGGARQPAHAPPPEHHPVRPHGRQPRLLRDPHVLLRQQHLQRDEPRGEGPRRHLPRPRPHVHRLQRHPRPALDPVREGPHLGAAGPRSLPPPPQELAT